MRDKCKKGIIKYGVNINVRKSYPFGDKYSIATNKWRVETDLPKFGRWRNYCDFLDHICYMYSNRCV